MTMHKKIAKLAKEQKVSQEDLATELGVAQSTVSAWFRGKSVPDVMQARYIAERLSVPLDYLADDNLDDPPVVTEEEKAVRQHVKRIGWSGVMDCLSRQIAGVGREGRPPKFGAM
jgi:transcriptional regulator with XRE-family HTH domain